MPYRYWDLDQFTRDYIDVALWSSMDDADESGGEPLDKNYSFKDIEDETVEDMRLDCEEFQKANVDDLELVDEVSHGGHDFWLTRNDHGAVFRDRGYGQSQEIEDALERLTKASKKYGEYDLWVGSAADLNEKTKVSGDSDEDDKKKIYAGHTRASSTRYQRRQRMESMTEPHGACEGSRTCLEHKQNKRVPSCKRSRGKGRLSK